MTPPNVELDIPAGTPVAEVCGDNRVILVTINGDVVVRPTIDHHTSISVDKGDHVLLSVGSSDVFVDAWNSGDPVLPFNKLNWAAHSKDLLTTEWAR